MRYLALVLLLASCGDNKKPVTGTLSRADEMWRREVLPILMQNCSSCHAAISPSFLDGNTPWEIRDSLLGSGLVDIAEPTRSFILTKGVHSGPGLTAAQTSTILEWILLEQSGE